MRALRPCWQGVQGSVKSVLHDQARCVVNLGNYIGLLFRHYFHNDLDSEVHMCWLQVLAEAAAGSEGQTPGAKTGG